MDKAERDKVMSMMGNDVRADFGQIMQETKSEAKSSGGARSKQDLLSERKNDCSEELQTRLDAVVCRKAMGLNEREVLPNFNLRRMDTGERVESSSFKVKSRWTWCSAVRFDLLPRAAGAHGRSSQQVRGEVELFLAHVREAHTAKMGNNVEDRVLFRQHQTPE